MPPFSMRFPRFLQCTVIVLCVAFPTTLFASNSYVDASDFAVSKAIRALRAQQPESVETIAVPKGNRMISTFAFPVTWRAQYATTASLPFLSANVLNVAVQVYDSPMLSKAVYDNGTAAVRGTKPGTLNLAKPLASYMYQPAFSPKGYLSYGGRDALVLVPYLDSMQMMDPEPTSVFLVADAMVLASSNDPPAVYLENAEKEFLKTISPTDNSFVKDWYVRSMTNVVSTQSTLFGQPSRILTFEADRGKARMKFFREMAVYPDYRKVVLEAIGTVADFDTLVMPVIRFLEQRTVVEFPPLTDQSYIDNAFKSTSSSSSSSISVKRSSSSSLTDNVRQSSSSSAVSKSVTRCSGTKAQVLKCRSKK